MSCYRRTEVITPAESYDLIDLDTLKLDLGITVDTDDEYLQRAISRASVAIMGYCGRVFAVETVTDSFSPNGSSSLVCSHYPVIEVESALGGYNLDMRRGLICHPTSSWTSAFSITYSGGYEEIPLDLQAAVLEVVKAIQFNRTRDPQLRSESILSGLYAYTLFDSKSLPAGTPGQVAGILDRYRSPAMA